MEKINALKIIGQNIKKYRAIKGITQEELADRVGLHRTYISLLERGGKNVGIMNIIALAKCLEVSIDKLIESPHE
jgi:transcriptional regulator with XRE-family HTH domain